MKEVIAKADKEVLVEVVKFAQKNGLKGAKGGWKDFLDCHDKKFGAGLSDPAKRSSDILAAFLATFTQEKDCKLFGKMIRRRSDHAAVEQFVKKFPDKETPQQRLVHLTAEHPQYAQCYSFPSHDEDWVIVPLGKISKAMKSKTLISVDCEMVLCEDGTDALVRVCVVDENLEVKLDEVVNPNKVVADYRTHITGITAKDLEGVTCSLVDVQKSLRKLLSHGTILVGHSLHNDLKALKIDHLQVIDTSFIFKFKDLPTCHSPSLNNLCKAVLGYEVRREGEPHNCLNDAQAAMKLVLAKLEHGFDDPIAVAGKDVPNSDLAKLLLHKIQIEIPCQELRRVFPMEYNIDIEADMKIKGQYYSTFAVFKNAGEADAAFSGLEGQANMDSSGRLQKHVSQTLSTGQTFSFYIRRMTAGGLLEDIKSPKKRLAPEDGSQGPKRQRTCQQHCDHVLEIERLKKQLSDREEEIFNLQMALAAVRRKKGL